MSKEIVSVAKYLKQLAEEIYDQSPDGIPQIRAYCLAELLWKYALGTSTFDPDTKITVIVPPAKWAMVLLLERIDGKLGGSNAADLVKPPGISERIDKTRKTALNEIAEPTVSTE